MGSNEGPLRGAAGRGVARAVAFVQACHGGLRSSQHQASLQAALTGKAPPTFSAFIPCSFVH